jgi:alpha-tubulin suppressor-like RCC1 family protein
MKFSDIKASASFTCGITDGNAYCWGSNVYGHLGAAGVPIDTALPVPVVGGAGLVVLALSYNDGCGLTAAGALLCWGLGFGPAKTIAGPSLQTLAGGGGHYCGLTTSGSAYCWGNNEDGRLGDSTIITRWTPGPVRGSFTFSTIAGGGYHTCATLSTGGSYCWGYNGLWQLGDSVPLNRDVLAPQPLHAGSPSFPALDGGNYSTCGMTGTGDVYCWGSNEWLQLGPNAGPYRQLATPVGLVATQLSVGTSFACALSVTGVAVCWGRNHAGQLGTGNSTTTATPRPVFGQPLP